MFLIISLTCFFVCFANSELLNFTNINITQLYAQFIAPGQTWFYFPNGDGVPEKASLNLTSSSIFINVNQSVYYYLYTRSCIENSQIINVTENISLLNVTYFDPKKAIKIICHGWRSSYKSDTSQTLKNNFLKVEDCNVILIDWDAIAGNIVYPIPAYATTLVGKHIAKMIDYLIKNGALLENIHLIGHSLGAHVVGVAGANVLNGKVKRISGLDAAKPGFESLTLVKGLNKDDAEFVDVIHTSANMAGVFDSIGDVDFYPNGGLAPQPGCIGLPQIIEACSHGKSWKYFAESILSGYKYMAVKCDNYIDYLINNCRNNIQIPMGYFVPTTARGKFYLKTNI